MLGLIARGRDGMAGAKADVEFPGSVQLRFSHMRSSVGSEPEPKTIE
jgi:hypothetical protein